MTNKYFLAFRRMLYDSGVFIGEYGKVFRFNNEILLIYAVWKIKPVWWQIILAVVLMLLFSAAAGRLLVRWKVVEVDKTIDNEQNRELKEILAVVKRIEQQNQLRELKNICDKCGAVNNWNTGHDCNYNCVHNKNSGRCSACYPGLGTWFNPADLK